MKTEADVVAVLKENADSLTKLSQSEPSFFVAVHDDLAYLVYKYTKIKHSSVELDMDPFLFMFIQELNYKLCELILALQDQETTDKEITEKLVECAASARSLVQSPKSDNQEV